MKKWILLITLMAMAAVQAETLSGQVYSQKSKKGKDFWKIGKEIKGGKMAAIANINKADFEKIAPFNGKRVDVTGELDSSSKFPVFLAGVQIKVVE